MNLASGRSNFSFRNRQRQAGLAANIVYLIVTLIALIIVTIVGCVAIKSAGSAHSINLQPSTLTLQESVPSAVTVQIALNMDANGLPTGMLTFSVDIDEDDRWDDRLYEDLKATYSSFDPSHPYAWTTFQLLCENLKSDGTFDLSVVGGSGKSTAEIVHLVHAEGDGNNSPNILCKCVTKLPPAAE